MAFEVAFCRAEKSNYVAFKDHYSIWIVDLNSPTEILTAFPETKPPVFDRAFSANEAGVVEEISVSYNQWLAELNQRKELLRISEAREELRR